MRKVEIRDLSLETDNSEYHLAFELKEKGQTGYVCFINTDKERNEWMAALTHLQTRRYNWGRYVRTSYVVLVHTYGLVEKKRSRRRKLLHPHPKLSLGLVPYRPLL